MDVDNAKFLIEELWNHRTTSKCLKGKDVKNLGLNKKQYIDELVQVSIDRTKPYIEIPFKTQKVEDDYFCYDLSLRRILINDNLENYKVDPFRRRYHFLLKLLEIYSSNSVCSDLFKNEDAMNVINKSRYKYSLLAKLRTVNKKNGKKYKRPLLIVPGHSKNEVINIFENMCMHVSEKELSKIDDFKYFIYYGIIDLYKSVFKGEKI